MAIGKTTKQQCEGAKRKKYIIKMQPYTQQQQIQTKGDDMVGMGKRAKKHANIMAHSLCAQEFIYYSKRHNMIISKKLKHVDKYYI